MFDLWKPGEPLWKPATRIVERIKETTRGLVHDGVSLLLMRRNRRGRPYLQKGIRCGPNMVSVFITHPDGSICDLGLSQNLLTNIGRDIWASWIGGFAPAGNTVAADISSLAPTGTTCTGTGSVWTASNLGTPQLGLAALRVYAAPHTTTLPVVYGNIISNTTNVLTIDKWWKADDTTGTTPTNGDAFIVGTGGLASVRFLAISADAGGASASDTVLASEITTNSLGRALASYAHTFGVATMTLSKVFTAGGSQAAIVKMGLFCDATGNSGGPMVFENTFSSASLVLNDQLTVTDTLTLSGP